jgi:hypothetical protein
MFGSVMRAWMDCGTTAVFEMVVSMTVRGRRVDGGFPMLLGYWSLGGKQVEGAFGVELEFGRHFRFIMSMRPVGNDGFGIGESGV